MKKEWESTRTFFTYNKAYPTIKTNEYYQRLPAQVAQQATRKTEQTYKSFFNLLKAKQRGIYKETVKEPWFLPKEGYFLLAFTLDYFQAQERRLESLLVNG